MPQPSYAYASARLAALSTKVLSAAAIRRLADGSFDDAMRSLLDIRYGNVPDATGADIERMIDNERKRTADEIRELSPNPKLTDLLLLTTDVHNLKVLVKARLLDSFDFTFLEGGLYGRELLEKAVAAADYRALPAWLSEALDALEARLRIGTDPQMISLLLDRAYLAHAREAAKTAGEPFIGQYFAAMCDFGNLLTIFRLRAMGMASEDMRGMLLPDGQIPARELLGACELSGEAVLGLLPSGALKAAVARGLADMQKTGNIGALERERDNYLLSLAREHKHDTLTIFPVVGYYLARDREAKAVRLILTVKKNGLDDAVIQERLRELYG